MTTHELTTLALNLDIRLRLAVHDDLHKLEWFGQYTHFRWLFRRAFREQQEGRRLMVIADCANFPIGHVFVQLNSAEPAVAQNGSRAYFYAFRVMEMFRGRGLGTAIMREAEALVCARGYQWVTIAVAKDNHDALRLYQRLGYRIFREDDGAWNYRDHRGEMRSVNEPCWMLEKQLSHNNTPRHPA